MRVSEVIGRVLVDRGVEVFFGLAGSGNFAVLNALLPDTDFAALARAAGAEGITVRNKGDLAPVEGWLERRDGRS